MEPSVNERVLEVIHRVIDLLGGGAQHLHAKLDDAVKPADPEAPTGNEDASGDPKDPAGQ